MIRRPNIKLGVCAIFINALLRDYSAMTNDQIDQSPGLCIYCFAL